MNQETQFDQVLSLLYESSLSPALLGPALGAMTDLLDGDTCHLVGWDRHTAAPLLSVSVGLEAEVGPGYAAHYAQLDPRRALALTRAPGQILACHEHFDKGFVSKSEFFQDYLLPMGIHFLLGSGDLLEESDRMVILGFHRHVGHAAFEPVQARLLERLLPHLQRSLRIARQVGEQGDAKHFSEATLEFSNLASLALSPSGTILWNNRRAETLLHDGEWVCQNHGVLCAKEADRNVSLTKLMSDTWLTGRPGSLNFRSAAKHCCITLLRMRDQNPLAITSQCAGLLALITTSAPQRVATVSQLMDMFKLSPAEARLVRALAHGESLDVYAAHQGLKRSTVKTQLSSATVKTGTQSQRDLTRLVLALPATRYEP